MELIRNQNADDRMLPVRGRYAVIDLQTGQWQDEFFVIMLKDARAPAALNGYADDVAKSDPEYAQQVHALAARGGRNHPNCKAPA